jgi:hypothetical protein
VAPRLLLVALHIGLLRVQRHLEVSEPDRCESSIISNLTFFTDCLTDAAPKKYIHYMDEPTPIVVQTSTRPLHMLNTEIFKIYLEEIVGFSRVDIVYHDEFKLEDVLKSISSMDLPESKT